MTPYLNCTHIANLAGGQAAKQTEGRRAKEKKYMHCIRLTDCAEGVPCMFEFEFYYSLRVLKQPIYNVQEISNLDHLLRTCNNTLRRPAVKTQQKESFCDG